MCCVNSLRSVARAAISKAAKEIDQESPQSRATPSRSTAAQVATAPNLPCCGLSAVAHTTSRLGWPTMWEARVRGGECSSGTCLSSAPISDCSTHCCFGFRHLRPCGTPEQANAYVVSGWCPLLASPCRLAFPTPYVFLFF